jgi:hypothetical protein
MLAAQNYAKLLSNANIPTGSIQQTVAPGTQGQFGVSPLAQIGSLGSILYSLYSGDPTSDENDAKTAIAGGKPLPKAEGGAVLMADGGMAEDVMPSGAAYHDGQGNYYNEHGYLVG